MITTVFALFSFVWNFGPFRSYSITGLPRAPLMGIW